MKFYETFNLENLPKESEKLQKSAKIGFVAVQRFANLVDFDRFRKMLKNVYLVAKTGVDTPGGTPDTFSF